MNNDEAGPSTAVPQDSDVLPHATDEGEQSVTHRNRPVEEYKFARIKHLDDLIRTLDLIVWVEIAIVYYMDNSFLRFILRSMVHLVYLMPKSPALVQSPDPQKQPYVGGIVGTNVLCLILHLYLARPEAGEATRGYLHGGLLLDFIGQRGPSSKLHLVLLDVAILVLQLVALAGTIKRRELKTSAKNKSSTRSATSNSYDQGSLSQSINQDHDAEERGELRRSSTQSEDTALMASSESMSELYSQPETPAGRRLWALADLAGSGQAMIAELFVVDTVRQQHNAYQAYRASAESSGVRGVRLNLNYGLTMPFRS